MNKKNILFTSLFLFGLTSTVIFGLQKGIDSQVSQASGEDNQTISNTDFVTVDNFAYSGKGVQFQFSFTVPETKQINTFNFMNSSWARLTKNFSMIFSSDGTVTPSIGKVLHLDGNYYYQIMFSDLLGNLNDSPGEVASGHETLSMMFFPSAPVRIKPEGTKIIDSTLNCSSDTDIRDGNTKGLRFKSYIGSTLKPSTTYGMLIVPSSYYAAYQGDYINNFQNDSKPYVDLTCEPILNKSTDLLYNEFGSGYYIQGSLAFIPDEHLYLDFVSIPYEKTEGYYTYGNFVERGKNNLFDVCFDIKNSSRIDSYSSGTKNYINSIVSNSSHVIKTSLSTVTPFFAYNTEQVEKSSSVPSGASSTIYLEGAKNEKESAQIILNFTGANNPLYYVNFEPFVNVSDETKVISSKNIEVYKELYTEVSSTWSEHYKQNQGFYTSGVESLPHGVFPDALLPFKTAIDSGENVLSNQNGNNNGIFFKLSIPKDAACGMYESKAIIRVVGEGTLVLPVSLCVYNFELSSENHSKTIINLSTSEISELYGANEGDTDKTYYRNAFKLLESRGISGGQLPVSKWSSQDLPLTIEEMKRVAKDEKIASYLLPLSYQDLSGTFTLKYKNSYSITKSSTVTLDNQPILSAKDYLYKPDPKITLYGYETLFTEMAKASTNEIDLFKKAILYFPQADEPGSDLSDQMQNILCQNSFYRARDAIAAQSSLFVGKESVLASLKKVPYIVTSQPRSILKGYVNDYKITSYDSYYVTSGYEDVAANSYCSTLSDIIYRTMNGYCPTYDCFQYFSSGSNKYGYQDLQTYLNDSSYSIWWYSCCQPVAPFPSLVINSPMIRKREIKWLQYLYGVQGEFYYMANRTQQVIGSESDGATYVPMTEDQILAGETTYAESYGDGLLIYPVRNKYKNIDSSLYYLSSLRLENIGESNDDYNYLYLANNLASQVSEDVYESGSASPGSLTYSLIPSPVQGQTSHSTFYNTRNQLANLIVYYQNNLA